MKIWLLTDKRNKKAYGNVRILEEAKNKGLKMKMVMVEDIELLIDNQLEDKIYINNKLVKLPNVVIPRVCVSYQMKSVTDFLEHRWVYMINDTASRFLAKDKFFSLQKLALNSLPIPKTILLKGLPNIWFIEEKLSYPIILKKIDGAQWKWILKINNRHDLEDVIEMLDESLNTLNKNIILQEYIGEKIGQDLRVFIVWWRVIAAMLRKGKDGDFKSNYSGGWNVFFHEVSSQEEIIALEAANIIGLDIAGIDILFDKNDGYKICEVNASPGFEWLEKASNVNIAWEIVDYIIQRFNISI